MEVHTDKPEKDYQVENAQFIPAISALFINGDFRVGATFFDYLDVAAMVSYAWYPDVWKKIVGFSLGGLNSKGNNILRIWY